MTEEEARLGFGLVTRHAGGPRRVSEKALNPKQCLELNTALGLRVESKKPRKDQLAIIRNESSRISVP